MPSFNNNTKVGVLIPGYFLIGQLRVRNSGLKIDFQGDKKGQNFSKRWTTEYLQTLQKRSK